MIGNVTKREMEFLNFAQEDLHLEILAGNRGGVETVLVSPWCFDSMCFMVLIYLICLERDIRQRYVFFCRNVSGWFKPWLERDPLSSCAQSRSYTKCRWRLVCMLIELWEKAWILTMEGGMNCCRQWNHVLHRACSSRSNYAKKIINCDCKNSRELSFWLGIRLRNSIINLIVSIFASLRRTM